MAFKYKNVNVLLGLYFLLIAPVIKANVTDKTIKDDSLATKLGNFTENVKDDFKPINFYAKDIFSRILSDLRGFKGKDKTEVKNTETSSISSFNNSSSDLHNSSLIIANSSEQEGSSSWLKQTEHFKEKSEDQMPGRRHKSYEIKFSNRTRTGREKAFPCLVSENDKFDRFRPDGRKKKTFLSFYSGNENEHFAKSMDFFPKRKVGLRSPFEKIFNIVHIKWFPKNTSMKNSLHPTKNVYSDDPFSNNDFGDGVSSGLVPSFEEIFNEEKRSMFDDFFPFLRNIDSIFDSGFNEVTGSGNAQKALKNEQNPKINLSKFLFPETDKISDEVWGRNKRKISTNNAKMFESTSNKNLPIDSKTTHDDSEIDLDKYFNYENEPGKGNEIVSIVNEPLNKMECMFYILALRLVPLLIGIAVSLAAITCFCQSRRIAAWTPYNRPNNNFHLYPEVKPMA